MKSITFPLWSDNTASAPVVAAIPEGFVFWSFEQDMNRPEGADNYFEVFVNDMDFVAIACPEKW